MYSTTADSHKAHLRRVMHQQRMEDTRSQVRYGIESYIAESTKRGQRVPNYGGWWLGRQAGMMRSGPSERRKSCRQRESMGPTRAAKDDDGWWDQVLELGFGRGQLDPPPLPDDDDHGWLPERGGWHPRYPGEEPPDPWEPPGDADGDGDGEPDCCARVQSQLNGYPPPPPHQANLPGGDDSSCPSPFPLTGAVDCGVASFKRLQDPVHGDWGEGHDYVLRGNFSKRGKLLIARAWAMLLKNVNLAEWAMCYSWGPSAFPQMRDEVIDVIWGTHQPKSPIRIRKYDTGAPFDCCSPWPEMRTIGINVRKFPWKNYIAMWRSSQPYEQMCATVDIATSLFHEMMHMAGLGNDEGIQHAKLTVAENLLKWALLQKYAGAACAQCCAGYIPDRFTVYRDAVRPIPRPADNVTYFHPPHWVYGSSATLYAGLYDENAYPVSWDPDLRPQDCQP